MRKYLYSIVGIVLAASLPGTGPAAAQNDRAVEAAPLNFVDVGSAPQKVDLILGKARILKLPTPVRDVLVASPDVADVVIRTPQLIYLLGRQVGDTNIFFFDVDGNEILRLDARVEMDLSALRATIKELMPDEEIKVSSVNNNIFLSGSVSSPDAAENARRIARRFVDDETNIVNMLDVLADQQVVIRVRVAEIQRTALKNLGLAYNFAKFDVGNFSSIGFALAESVAPGAGVAFASFGTTNTTLNVLIDALENNGLVKTLAEPNLTALSGEAANFLAGGEFPIITAQTSGDPNDPEGEFSGIFTTTYRPFGVSLDFSPIVQSSGRINLRVATEVSAIASFTAQGLPVFNVRSTETTVELPSGGSLVIGGLLQDDITNSIDGIPGLKDIPILGALFRSARFRRQETELVIAVTVYLVNPIEPQQVTLPTDGFAPASDIDTYLFGRLSAVYAKSERFPASGDLKAPTGYIME
jgi:pilus assembly protein CpaC